MRLFLHVHSCKESNAILLFDSTDIQRVQVRTGFKSCPHGGPHLGLEHAILVLVAQQSNSAQLIQWTCVIFIFMNVTCSSCRGTKMGTIFMHVCIL